MIPYSTWLPLPHPGPSGGAVLSKGPRNERDQWVNSRLRLQYSATSFGL